MVPSRPSWMPEPVLDTIVKVSGEVAPEGTDKHLLRAALASGTQNGEGRSLASGRNAGEDKAPTNGSSAKPIIPTATIGVVTHQGDDGTHGDEERPNYMSGESLHYEGLARRSSQVHKKYDKDKVKSAVLSKVKDYYTHLFGKGRNVGTSIQFHCPWHEDKSPSLSVSQDHGGYRCHGCGVSGDIFIAWMKIKSVEFREALVQIAEWAGDPAPAPHHRASTAEKKGGTIWLKDEKTHSKLKTAQETILKKDSVLNRLFNNYGVTIDSVKRYGLGWDANSYRLWIPVYHRGKLVNIRKHDIMRAHCIWERGGKVYKNLPDGEDPAQFNASWGTDVCRPHGKNGGKVIGVRGHNSITLYPSESVGTPQASLSEVRQETDSWVCVTGGELKAVLLNQMGVPAVCFTCGEGSYAKKWLDVFNGLDVEICLDSDPAGKRGADRLARAIADHARRVRIVDLPFGDPNDYYREREWDFSDWKRIPRRNYKEEYKRESVDIPFTGLRDPDFYNKEVRFRGVIAGSGDTPYFVAEKVTAKCTRGQVNPIPSCEKCALPGCGFDTSWVVPTETLIDIKSLSPKKQKKYLRDDVAGIPSGCSHPDIEYSMRRIAHVGLVQDVDSLREDVDDDQQASYFVHRAYYVGQAEPRENEPHSCTGKIIQDPKDSTVSLLLRDMDPVKRSFEDSHMDDNVVSAIRSLPGGNSSTQYVQDRLSYLVYEFSELVSQIYGQSDLILGSLLAFFMPIRFSLNKRMNEKIGAEVLLIGDTRAGKTTISKAIMRHYKVGRFISCEGATYAGLVGGADSIGSKKFFTWGALPTQDKGVAVLDEIDDIVTSGVFSKLTSIRSDGIAARTIAGGLRQCSARLRMLMCTNPLGNRKMASYGSTMFAINELISTPQDVARFEYAIGVYRDDNPDIYNKQPSEDVPVYSSDIATQHIRWAWRQRPELSGDVAAEVLKCSTELSNEFKGLTLLPPSEARWKVARLACAIAALSFSMDKFNKVDVTSSHVQVAKQWFINLYGSKWFAYKKYVGQGISDSKEIRTYLDRLGQKKIDYLYYNDSFTGEVIDTLIMGISNRHEFLKILSIDNNCMVRRRSGYYKSDGFKELLEQLRSH